MGVFRQGRSGCSWWSAVALIGLCGAAAIRAMPAQEQARMSPWDRAVEARQEFEAEPAQTHTRQEYAEVMDGFRAIYHGDPGGAHAARAVVQVAELLAEQGREFGDKKSLHDAAGQYEYLAKAYPGGTMAPRALEQALELLEPADAAEASRVRAELEEDYLRYGPARTARVDQGKGAGSGGAENDAGLSAASAQPPHAGKDRPKGTPVNADSGGDDRAGRLQEAEPVVRETASVGRIIPEVPEKEQAGPLSVVTGIRHWSTASYTRVAIDLRVDPGEDVRYEAARVEHPDRIFFDLHHARLASQLVGKSFTVTDDGFLMKIRAAQFSDDVTRVVLDVHEVAEYSAFLLPNPYRLIIDIHGKQASPNKEDAAVDWAQTAGNANTGVSPLRPHEAADFGRDDRSVADKTDIGRAAETSSLPPMPVTDGSTSFGLPARRVSVEGAERMAARPRVVISSKPTAAKPVPNTVTRRSVDLRTEVAAVSEQPGKVEATRRPTSQPISSGVRRPDSAIRSATIEAENSSKARDEAGEEVAHERGEPVTPAVATADGETSLVRALGLKIGRIVIDAGHGGHDSGTLGVGGIEEKDVVLDVALRLGKLLHDRLGADVVYTRADDTFIPLETRTAIANKAQADLFISVHANSSSDPNARGVEVYYLNFTSDPGAMEVASRENAVSTQSVHELSDLVKKIALKDKIDESRELASNVDASLYAGLRRGNPGLKNRGVKKAPFVVLIGANMPSILAEISFVTNPVDAAKLETPEYRERVAESLYKGIARYAEGINGVGSRERMTEQAESYADGGR